ncbi:MAG: hypothetical protein CSA66_02320 [Proteobacteria bacterium]|nr:MAG: hypothetical protein CSA66_02320 [Pseudomonadota bacterium]
MNVAIDHKAHRSSGMMSAELVRGRGFGSAGSAVLASRLGRRAVVVSTAMGEGAYAWLRMDLPDGGSIRPLVQATASARGGTACRIVHLFPDDQRALDAYHAGRATASGY